MISDDDIVAIDEADVIMCEFNNFVVDMKFERLMIFSQLARVSFRARYCVSGEYGPERLPPLKMPGLRYIENLGMEQAVPEYLWNCCPTPGSSLIDQSSS
jgi:hypothetical protein